MCAVARLPTLFAFRLHRGRLLGLNAAAAVVVGLLGEIVAIFARVSEVVSAALYAFVVSLLSIEPTAAAVALSQLYCDGAIDAVWFQSPALPFAVFVGMMLAALSVLPAEAIAPQLFVESIGESPEN